MTEEKTPEPTNRLRSLSIPLEGVEIPKGVLEALAETHDPDALRAASELLARAADANRPRKPAQPGPVHPDHPPAGQPLPNDGIVMVDVPDDFSQRNLAVLNMTGPHGALPIDVSKVTRWDSQEPGKAALKIPCPSGVSPEKVRQSVRWLVDQVEAQKAAGEPLRPVPPIGGVKGSGQGRG